MAKYSFSWTSLAFTATADTADIADNTFAAIKGGDATQRNLVSEIYIGGEASASSSPVMAVFARSSTVSTGGLTGGRNALLDGSATAPATTAGAGTAATTVQPQRSATLHLLHLSYNAYGGIVRWVAPPGGEISIVGNTASLGEATLSGFTGSTAATNCSGHIIYETV
jgi:hypothetical protein